MSFETTFNKIGTIQDTLWGLGTKYRYITTIVIILSVYIYFKLKPRSTKPDRAEMQIQDDTQKEITEDNTKK